MLKSASEMAEMYQSAIEAILGGAQSYDVGNTTVTRASLSVVEKKYGYWVARAKKEALGINAGDVRGNYLEVGF